MTLDVRTLRTMTGSLASAGRVSSHYARESAERIGSFGRQGWSRAQGAWAKVGPDERLRLRNDLLALAAAVAATLLTLAAGLAPAGLLILADVVIFAAAYLGGLSCGIVAALGVVISARLGSPALTGAQVATWIALLAGAKGIGVAGLATAFAMRVASDTKENGELERVVRGLTADVHGLRRDLAAKERSAAATEDALSKEADLARQQLTTLQSVTDPALNALKDDELVTTVLERLRLAVGADGVACCPTEGRTRVLAADGGLQPCASAARGTKDVTDRAPRRTSLVHNDAKQVAESSVCGWPADVTSLIAVPVIQAGRLRLVVEVASLRGRLSTEWELALIQVVAERAAGWVRADAYSVASA